MGWFSSVTDAIGDTVKKAVDNPIINPVGYIAHKAVSAVTKPLFGADISPSEGYKIGAGIGTAAVAARGLGLFGSGVPGVAGSAGIPTAGVNGVVSGTSAAFGSGGAGVMAQSGGVPLLTKVLLGASVASTLAGYFGTGKSDKDYKDWFDSLNAEDQAQVKSLEDNLTSLQKNLDDRNVAVQKVLQDYPNVVSQVAPEVVAAKQRAGEEFDAASKPYIDLALNQNAAKYAAGGGLSSGAMAAASARVGAEMGLKRLAYTTSQGDQALAINEKKFDNDLSEVEALRNFQQKMLGVNIDQTFNARQATFNRRSNQLGEIAGIDNSQNIRKDTSTQELFGSLGKTAGDFAMLPMYQQLFNPNKWQAMPNAGTPAAPNPNPAVPTAGVMGYVGRE